MKEQFKKILESRLLELIVYTDIGTTAPVRSEDLNRLMKLVVLNDTLLKACNKEKK